ncbi:UPF0197 transmembrane protein [Heterostelium album PN500]|uniref:Dolichyl-diphosphooligosaccharide-protein glycosyltransferase subunit OST5 n=1 Tax=Heterostelium pallidum (strain ATCC 26659 / Pp 5 / PN500) TaxID=670386 RepID=D3BSI8_HETP5|nr:UPF0197 transmembrane protein [Heterostelium album PN500]EFA75453.1 UPF0197 transmembrane protein [Heterostelium album PN500]|eukprot:XP_020427587.1 UPF0197 transmembrane protein [Heterostelium album PN500]
MVTLFNRIIMYSPVDPSLYPFFAFLFLVVGFAFLASFIVYEISAGSGKSKRNIVQEVLHALVASCTLGMGGFFVLLASGIYL